MCKEEGTVHFMDTASAVSGVWEFAPIPFRDRWWKGKTVDDATPIRCVPLRAILADQGPTFFADFFSLDVEGAELQVPQSNTLGPSPLHPTPPLATATTIARKRRTRAGGQLRVAVAVMMRRSVRPRQWKSCPFRYSRYPLVLCRVGS